MKRLLSTLTIAAALVVAVRLTAADAPAAPGDLKFTTHNAVYNAEGTFKSWRFTKVDIPGGDLTKGTVTLEVDLASVSEKTDKLAAHLRTADFFDVATFPKATIVISGVKAAGDKKYEATADLDLHGVKASCPVKFDVVSSSPLAIKGTATLNRTSFKVGQPHNADDKYSPLNEVQIEIDAKVQ